MIDCQRVSYQIRGAYLLKDVSWRFATGKISAIIGANGAGKSTLMRSFLGAVTPQSGDIRFAGRPLAQWSLQSLARQRAYMSQSGASRLNLTVIEYLLLARVNFNESQSTTDRHVENVVERLSLEALALKHIDELSGGEYQRVELARAWCQLVEDEQLNGKLLLLDEPASALDIGQSQNLYQYLQRFASLGGTVIVVEHDINTAARYCDEILLLKNGRCVAAGSTSSVFTESNINQCFSVNGQLLRNGANNGLSFSL